MTVVRPRPSRFARTLRALTWGLAALLAAGCGGRSNAGLGTVVITLGDTSGDFASYIVGVDAITLTESNGQVITPLAVAQSVDLAALTDLGQLVEAPAVPAASYTSASITLDYTTSNIWLNSGGQAIAAAALNPGGTAMTTQTVIITFDPANPLVITQGKSTRLAIDVNLAASNTINSAAAPVTVTAQPFVVATPAPADAAVLRARGLFVTSQSGSSAFIMNLRPFSDVVSALGAVTVMTSSQTYFNVNGVAYTGAAGLAALAQVPINTTTAAFGTLTDLSGITPSFTATAVYAGTSLESPLADHINGVVSARSGNVLTVHGAGYLSRLGVHSYTNNALVAVGSNTIVSQDGVVASGLGLQSLSIGQQLDVSGQGGTDSSGNLVLDATAGQVRLAPTRLWCTLNSASPGSATVNLLTLANFAPAGFNFAGTGMAGQDASPASYALNTGSLDESAVAANTLLQVDGFVTAFGSAPPDFTASAITPGTSTQEELVAEWVNGGATNPFVSASSAGLVVDLSNSSLGTTHYIRTGPNSVDLVSLPASPTITTVGATGDLQLAVGSTTLTSGISVFSTASAFATALSSTLNGTNKVYRLVAAGQYTAASNTFVATRISVALHE